MNNSYKVKRLSFQTIQELPYSWNEQKYKDLLDAMEYDDTAEIPTEELKEMCLMSLSDYDPEEAAKIVLDYVFKNRLKSGQILNLSNEMLEDRIWEEYADLSMHEELFNVNQLLYQAYNGQFPYPEAVRFQISVVARQKEDLMVFDSYTEATLIRLLVAGMPENTLIFRLFEEQVVGNEFSDAKDIIWQLKSEKNSENELIFDIISSTYWFHDLKFVDDFEAETHSDYLNN